MIPFWFIFIAAALNFVGGVSYVVETLQGKSKPNRVTWLLWALAPMVAVAAQLSSGVGWPTLMVFMNGFVPLMVFTASFVNPKAYWKITQLDYICGGFALLGIILWALTSNPALAVIFSVLSDGLAAIPTIRKAYTNPETENGKTFLLATFASILAWLTIKNHSFVADTFTLYIIAVCTLLSFLIYRKKLGKFFHA